MKINNWLKGSTTSLRSSGIDSARLDCLILLEDSTKKDRAWLLAHPEFELTSNQIAHLSDQIERRKTHTPLAYIRSQVEFYGREFFVNQNVLVPRPETESMITLVKEIVGNQKYRLIDIGTGSGAIAITTKLELAQTDVVAIDIDHLCLEVTRKNAEVLGADIAFLRGDLLTPLAKLETSLPIIIMANLPYVPNEHLINQAASNEPHQAIFGGPNGLELYQKMFQQIGTLADKPRYVITESLDFQHNQLAAIAQTNRYKLIKTDGLAQLFEQAK